MSSPRPASSRTSRRAVLRAGVSCAASLQILSSRVWGQSPNSKLQLGFIGAGGRGEANIGAFCDETIAVLCDVDERRCERMVGAHPSAKFYRDWRLMLEKEADKLDAVVISTPDHTHAVAAITALRLGKPVYLEKPLARTISEVRALLEASRKAGVCTQMGNMGHAAEGARLTNEWIRSGALGDIHEVHCVTNRPIWPQDVVRGAKATPPAYLNWDLWQGPVAERPFAANLLPFVWRGFVDYGTGALGDMGPHLLDHPVWALGLGPPKTVEIECIRKNPQSLLHTYPAASTITFQFGAVEGRPPLKIVWYDGRRPLPRPPGLKDTGKPLENACIYYGSKLVMMHSSHGGMPQILTGPKDLAPPPRTEERSPGHYLEWLDAIRHQDPARAKSNFEIAAPLTETLLLGCLAAQLGNGTRLTWDPVAMTTGNEVADARVQHHYRSGWEL